MTDREELQSELMEQCRLLGMSAERELKLRTEIERQKARYALLEESYNLLRAEIDEMRKQESNDERTWYVLVEPTYWRPMPAAPGTQENNDA